MKRAFLWTALRAGVLVCPVFLATTTSFAQSSNVVAQSAKPVISLDPGQTSNATSAIRVKGEASFANAPANFHSFPSARVGESTYVETLTLRFAASTKLTKIESSKDFQVEQGGSCAAESIFAAGDSCTLLVRFTPQGPGQRLGKVTISHTTSAEPYAFGIGGFGYAPVVSFTPAIITTVPGTLPSGVGLLNGAINLTVDGGDSLYIADTGNNVIRYLDSSGIFKTLASGYTGPVGIAVDTFGEVYFDLNSSANMYEIYDYGPVVQINGAGSLTCTAASPCNLSGEALGAPGKLSMDPYNHLFFPDSHAGAAMVTVQPLPDKLVLMYNPFPYQTNPSSAMTVDSSDNIYSFWTTSGECTIMQASLYNAENSNVMFNKIAGGHTCGFSGDGGEAGNAEIGSTVGQMAFDIAGNLYFSDTANQRVRRIDYVTGIINTIAGTGVAGYICDGCPGTHAQLSSPTGVAVDSEGQVYIITGTAATGTAQVIRKLGPNGFLNLGGQLKGTTGSAQQVTVANTGNSSLTLTNVVFTGTNPSDFAIDPNTTSCILTAGATLSSGQSCKVGFLFKPSAGGIRTANVVFLDNTVTGSNTVQLYGVGTLPAPTFTITSPTTGTSVTAGTAVTFTVSVTSSSSPPPTGKVTMLLDGATISGSPATLNSSGVASLSVVTSVTGTHTLSATYSGDANYAASGPITRTYTVTAAITKPVIKLSSSANPATSCQAVVFSVTVTGTSGDTPTGKVELYKGASVLDTATLNKGEATLTTSALTVGTNVLAASYGGDARNRASTSATLNQVISSNRLCGVMPPPLHPVMLP